MRRLVGLGSVLWALLPAVSLGFLVPVPFLHAAVKFRDRLAWFVAGAYLVVEVALLVRLSALPLEESSVYDFLWLSLIIVATIHAFLLRGRVFAISPTQALASQPVVAAALAARERREQARMMAAQDPALSRELRIGRPDLQRDFDDGGLVDVNSVPTAILIDKLGLTSAQAAQVVDARERLGGFSGPEELSAFGEIPEALVETIGERLLFLR
jgi:hypothetical protein